MQDKIEQIHQAIQHIPESQMRLAEAFAATSAAVAYTALATSLSHRPETSRPENTTARAACRLAAAGFVYLAAKRFQDFHGLRADVVYSAPGEIGSA